MNTAGGDDWTTAGTIDSTGVTPSTARTDMVVGSGDPAYWAAWWEISFGTDQYVVLDASPTTDDTTGSADALMVVYTGSDFASKVEVVSDDDSGTAYLPRLSFLAAAGETYHVALGTWDPAGDGIVDYLIAAQVLAIVPPTNDDWADAVPIALNETVAPLVAAATTEVDEDTLFPFSYRSVWYRYDATYSGMLGFDVIDGDGPGSGPFWAVCTGASLAGLSIVGYGYGPNQHVDVVNGQTYWIRLATQDEDTNLITARLRRYQWGPWQRDADEVHAASATMFQQRAYFLETTQHVQAAPGSEAARVSLANGQIDGDMSTLLADNDGFDATFITAPTTTTGTSSITEARHTWSTSVQIGNPAFGTASENVGSTQHFAQSLVVNAAGLGSYISTSGVDWENDEAAVVGASLDVLFSHWITHGAMFADGSAEALVKAFIPTLSDLTILQHPYVEYEVIGATAVSTTVVDSTATLTLTESDFAGAETQDVGVVLFAMIAPDASPQITSAPYTSGLQGWTARAQVDVDPDTSTFTLRPPRYRLLEVVEGEPVGLTWWDGEIRQPATLLGWWDGENIRPATLNGWFDGATTQPST